MWKSFKYINFNLIKFFFIKYIYTINHKRIALNYLYFSIFSGLCGTFLATLIRLELALPGSYFFNGDSIKYLQVITTHGLIMVFFVVIPIFFGFFANFFIPYHIGSKDVAFPRLNSLGFWILFLGFILFSKPTFLRRNWYKYYLNTEYYKSYNDITTFNLKNIFYNFLSQPILNFFNKELFYLNKIKTTFIIYNSNASNTLSGWTLITPFSSKIKYTNFGSQDIIVITIILAGLSTTLSFVNLLITRRTLSSTGIRYRKNIIPFLSINLFLTMRMLALITPVLGAGVIMLQLDRQFGFSFFDYSYGGDPVLFHHLFWFFGHPEVYVVIIPSFGIISMILPFSNSKHITAKNHLIWATYIMAYMGFLVWGHHMYLIGLDHRSRSLYSTITIMIALPAIVKIINWTLTLFNGMIIFSIPLLFAFAFLLFFICGGLTGMWLSHVGLNIFVHDTFYVVAHFHFMFSASTFSAIFCGIYFYFYQIFYTNYIKIFGLLHLFYWFTGQWLTFLPLFWVGYNGLPRRYHDYPLVFLNWHALSSTGHILTLISIIFFLLNIFFSKIHNNINNIQQQKINKRVLFFLKKIQSFKKYG